MSTVFEVSWYLLGNLKIVALVTSRPHSNVILLSESISSALVIVDSSG